MDSLKKTQFYQEMKDRIHFTHFEAVNSIDPEQAARIRDNVFKDIK